MGLEASVSNTAVAKGAIEALGDMEIRMGRTHRGYVPTVMGGEMGNE